MEKTLSANSSQSGGSNKSLNVCNIFKKCIDYSQIINPMLVARAYLTPLVALWSF